MRVSSSPVAARQSRDVCNNQGNRIEKREQPLIKLTVLSSDMCSMCGWTLRDYGKTSGDAKVATNQFSLDVEGSAANRRNAIFRRINSVPQI
jgi:hypothetical protein